ncbi:MAG: hypothetical protein RBT80_13105 [Candidatus Vecturithrix sp.]|jgi:hypothetical protein|nr:hypothetical protein [Candidatus Vecturithrix sp.]
MKTFTMRKYSIIGIALVVVSLFILSGCASLSPSREYSVADNNAKHLKSSEGEDYPDSNYWHVPETSVSEQ